jgi:hypothetical protein
MVFRQAMVSAELVSAVRTTKRKKGFLPTLSTFHKLRAPFFMGKKRSGRLYVSLRNLTDTTASGAKRLKL